MKRLRNATSWLGLKCLPILALVALAWPVSLAGAQGVTTGAIVGIVTNEQQQPVAGASVIAIHLPSGTTYEANSRADGRFSILGARVGGPYSVTVAFTGGGGTAFQSETKEDITVNLGVSADVVFVVRAIAVQETVTVSATVDPVFSSARTGAATAVNRQDLYTLPTVTGRISDMTRLTPQATGSSFAGQDNRLNNITVDGSYFNNPFGLGDGQPGGRTNVAPISLESIEQVQVSIAPFDVRQGNFVGAAVNTVTRSGTNELRGSFYHRTRNDGFVGTEADGVRVNPGIFTFRNTGGWAGGPIVRNKLFVFGTYENEMDKRPMYTFRANNGGEPVTGNVSRVLASDLTTLSAYLKQNFQYETGPYQDLNSDTPAKRYLVRGDYNLNNRNKISFRYNQLDSSSTKLISGSTSAGIGRSIGANGFTFAASNYAQLETIKSGIGEWNAVIGDSMSNSLISGYTSNDESREDPGKLFPLVDILGPDGTQYITFGSEPFTPNNELRYKTFQLQDNFTKFTSKHSLTVGGTMQRYESDNVFFGCCKQGAFVYNSLADFYTDANEFLTNPNRTTSPVTLRRYQVRYMNLPGLDKPSQLLKVLYAGGYAQDEWRPKSNVTITAGVRFDIPSFGATGYPNPNADALTFRNEDGSAVRYSSGDLPDPQILWSPRVGFNWDVDGNQQTQVRGGLGIFTGQPLFVWISNQIGNTGMLQGLLLDDNTRNRPFSTNIDRYKPQSVTGAGAASYELDVTQSDFKFPQVWRNNIAVDRRLPGGMTATAEFVYNRDVNGIYYINSNLPAAQGAFAGVDNRPRWVGVACGSGTPGPCVNRINNAPGNQVTAAIVMKNQSVGRSWNLSGMLAKTTASLSLRGAYSYGDAKNTIDPGSTAFSSWALNPMPADPNNPGLGRSNGAQGHRFFGQATYTKSYFGFGSTTVSAFWETKGQMVTAGSGVSNNVSYVFAGDMNGDGAAGNDLIYIPRDRSEMNFVPFTAGTRTFTAEEQANAFEAYIQQDKYLSKHRGQYAERGGLFMPLVSRMDLSIIQDVFRNVGGKRNAGQFRIDIMNFGNLLNHNWGVGPRMVVPITQGYGAQILTNAAVDAQGRVAYRMATAGGQLVTQSFQTSGSLGTSNGVPSDVYQFMLSFRYSFN